MIALNGDETWKHDELVYIRMKCEECGQSLNVSGGSFLHNACLHYHSYQQVWDRQIINKHCIKCNYYNEYTTERRYVCYNCRI